MTMAYVFMLLCSSILCIGTSEGSSETLYLLSYADSEVSVDLVRSSVNDKYVFVSQKTESLSLNIAAELAVDLINNRSDILPGYTLELLKREGGCTTFNYVSFFQDLIYSNKKVVGIVGPGCAESSNAVGFQIAKSNLSMMSVGLSSTLQTEVLTNSFSLLNPMDYAHALLKMIKNNDWTRLLVVYDITSNYYKNIFNYFREKLPENVDLKHQPLHSSTLNDPDKPGRACIDHPRIFIVIAETNLTAGIMCWFRTNYGRAFSYPNFQYVIVGHEMDEIVDSAIACNSSISIRDQLKGAIFLRHNPNTTTSTTVSGLSFEQFNDEYSRRITKFNQNQSNSNILNTSFYGSFYFDAVWTQVLALNVTIRNGFNLSDYRYGNTDFSNEIRENLLSLNFTGISGQVKFNESSRFVNRIVDIYQVKNSSMRRLEYYDRMEDRIHIYGNDSIHYINSKFRTVIDKMFLGIVLFIVITLLASALIALQTVTFVYKNHHSIKATSPNLRHLSYIGCYLILVGCFLTTVSNYCKTNTFNPCLINHWAEFFIGTGSVLLFSTLTSISFRMYRIFVHYMHPGKFIQDSWLIGFTLVATGLYLLCTISGYALAHPEAIIKCISIDEEEMVMIIKITCEHRYGFYKLLMLVFPLGLTVSACMFSLLSNRKVTIKKFRTTSVTILSYIFFLVVIISTLFYILKLPKNPEVEVTLVIHTILACSCIVFLYLPPAWPIFKQWCKATFFQHHLTVCI